MFINPICFIIQLPILCWLHSKITNLSRKGTHKKLVTITLNKMKTHVKKRVIQIHPSFPLFYLKSFRHICSSDFIVFVGQHSFFKLTRFKHLQKKTSTFFSSLSFLKNWVLLTELLMQIYHCKGFLKLTFWTLAMHQSTDKCWKPQDLRRTKKKNRKKNWSLMITSL